MKLETYSEIAAKKKGLPPFKFQAVCDKCGKRKGGVLLRQRVNPRNYSVEQKKLCPQCSSGYSPVYGQMLGAGAREF